MQCVRRIPYTQFIAHVLTGADHIANYVRPIAVIVDGSYTEDRSFLDSIKDQMIDAPRTTLIELPAKAQSRLSWMSQLDAAALAGKWDNDDAGGTNNG